MNDIDESAFIFQPISTLSTTWTVPQASPRHFSVASDANKKAIYLKGE